MVEVLDIIVPFLKVSFVVAFIFIFIFIIWFGLKGIGFFKMIKAMMIKSRKKIVLKDTELIDYCVKRAIAGWTTENLRNELRLVMQEKGEPLLKVGEEINLSEEEIKSKESLYNLLFKGRNIKQRYNDILLAFELTKQEMKGGIADGKETRH